LGPDAGRTQGYLSPARVGLKFILATTNDTRLFWVLQNVGPKDSWVLGCPSATCTLRCQAPRQATQAPRMHRGVPSTETGPKRHMGVGGVPSLQATI